VAIHEAVLANGAEPQEALREIVDFLIDETVRRPERLASG